MNHLPELMNLHFDPRWGTPYWLAQRGHLTFDPADVSTLADLRHFPPFPREALAQWPVQHFVPRKFHAEMSRLVICETGGTTGPPARTAFREDEFHAAFVAPFLAAAAFTGFPRNISWLFVGPSGPHPIGKAARLCATASGAMDPFTVDFDPRWARKLSGFALERYRLHVMEQTLDILKTQEVGVLFATPPVLSALAEKLEPSRREQIAGIHTGGIAPPQIFWQQLAEAFPKAKIMSGYGNSLCGMCPQLHFDPTQAPSYFAHQERLVLELRQGDFEAADLWFHRLDESCFLPNVPERDVAAPASPPPGAAAHGFCRLGIANPRPPADSTLAQGLY